MPRSPDWRSLNAPVAEGAEHQGQVQRYHYHTALRGPLTALPRWSDRATTPDMPTLPGLQCV